MTCDSACLGQASETSEVLTTSIWGTDPGIQWLNLTMKEFESRTAKALQESCVLAHAIKHMAVDIKIGSIKFHPIYSMSR